MAYRSGHKSVGAGEEQDAGGRNGGARALTLHILPICQASMHLFALGYESYA